MFLPANRRVFAAISVAIALITSQSLTSAQADQARRISTPSSSISISDHSSSHSADSGDECEDSDISSSNWHSDSSSKHSSSKNKSSKNKSSIESSSLESEDSCSSHSDSSTATNSATKVPLTLAAPSITSCSTTASLSWVGLSAAGYAPVDSYQVRYSSDNGLTWTVFATQTAVTTLDLTGLASGLTYIFQVAAHNVNGWGVWSPSTTGCSVITAATPNYTFTLNGLANVPVTGGSTLPIIFLGYQDATGPIFRTVGSTQGDSGSFAKGTYASDLYIVLPPKVGGYTFTVTAGAFSQASLGLASGVSATGNPADISTIVGAIYPDYVTYAFTVTSGSTLDIVINP